jgi:succinate-semialdehyde dehydrogenase/glutarate-semialdehyde dehydrogenase
MDEGVTQGHLVNSAAVQKSDGHVRDAIRKGAILRTGGKRPEGLSGFFYEPTVITNATTQMDVARDKTFGPLAALLAFKTEDEAVSVSNATKYGLAAYLMSKSIGRVFRVARRLECRILGVNTGLISAAESSVGWGGGGGFKESGMGREGSKYGLAEYQNIKAITIGNLQAPQR